MGDCPYWLGVDKCFLNEGHDGEHRCKWASDLVTIMFRSGDNGVFLGPRKDHRYV